MLRILEPEVKDSDQAQAYAGTDFSASNQFFVDALLKDYSELAAKRHRYWLRTLRHDGEACECAPPHSDHGD